MRACKVTAASNHEGGFSGCLAVPWKGNIPNTLSAASGARCSTSHNTVMTEATLQLQLSLALLMIKPGPQPSLTQA